MSIRVALDEIADAAAAQAPFAYLLTVTGDARTHIVAVTPDVREGVIACSAGRTTCANAAARPDVVLLWPPARPDDSSLIVDGTAHVDGEQISVTPPGAVRHRPAPGLPAG